MKSLTEMQGGRLWAEGEGAGRGSRFTVELPLADKPCPAGEPAPARAEPSPGS